MKLETINFFIYCLPPKCLLENLTRTRLFVNRYFRSHHRLENSHVSVANLQARDQKHWRASKDCLDFFKEKEISSIVLNDRLKDRRNPATVVKWWIQSMVGIPPANFWAESPLTNHKAFETFKPSWVIYCRIIRRTGESTDLWTHFRVKFVFKFSRNVGTAWSPNTRASS